MATPDNEPESMEDELHEGGSTSGGRSFRAQSRKVAEDVKELGGIAIGETGAAAARIGDRVRERGGELFEQGRERIYKVRDQVGGFLSERPFQTLFIALGAGALLGFLIRRR
jgi:ElaB/YqjD/DUF883 family membrane-anchored ribosome-binding protein